MENPTSVEVPEEWDSCSIYVSDNDGAICDFFAREFNLITDGTSARRIRLIVQKGADRKKIYPSQPAFSQALQQFIDKGVEIIFN